jgi:hypothetical protein
METIAIPGAEICYEKNFFSAEEAATLFHALEAKCAWERHRSSFKYAVPRDEAYYGDPGTRYTYSRREYRPLAWIPELLSLKARVEEATPPQAYANLNLPKLAYNAVLCNLNRNGTRYLIILIFFPSAGGFRCPRLANPLWTLCRQVLDILDDFG